MLYAAMTSETSGVRSSGASGDALRVPCSNARQRTKTDGAKGPTWLRGTHRADHVLGAEPRRGRGAAGPLPVAHGLDDAQARAFVAVTNESLVVGGHRLRQVEARTLRRPSSS